MNRIYNEVLKIQSTEDKVRGYASIPGKLMDNEKVYFNLLCWY